MKYNIGLALSGGGVRGFAHIGAIMALEEAGIKPDVIAGTSAGAIVGALYASGYTPTEIFDLFKNTALLNFTKFAIPKNGLFSTADFVKFLKKSIKCERFEELSIPLHAVATNLDSGLGVVFSEGELPKRIMASSCVPVVFKPMEIDGINYVDGCIYRNFPVSVIRDMCKTVIGINVNPLPEKKYSKSIIGIAERSCTLMFRAITNEEIKLCDIYVEPQEIAQYNMFELKKREIIFKHGYAAMKEKLKELSPKKY